MTMRTVVIALLLVSSSCGSAKPGQDSNAGTSLTCGLTVQSRANLPDMGESWVVSQGLLLVLRFPSAAENIFVGEPIDVVRRHPELRATLDGVWFAPSVDGASAVIAVLSGDDDEACSVYRSVVGITDDIVEGYVSRE